MIIFCIDAEDVENEDNYENYDTCIALYIKPIFPLDFLFQSFVCFQVANPGSTCIGVDLNRNFPEG